MLRKLDDKKLRSIEGWGLHPSYNVIKEYADGLKNHYASELFNKADKQVNIEEAGLVAVRCASELKSIVNMMRLPERAKKILKKRKEKEEKEEKKKVRNNILNK